MKFCLTLVLIKQMANLTKQGFITATDLADYFVKQLKYPFRKAYMLTAKNNKFLRKE